MTPNIVKGSNSLPGDRYDDPDHPGNKAEFQPQSLIEKKQKQSEDMSSGGMDGDHSAKTMDAGANKATQGTDMADAIHEDAKQTVPSPYHEIIACTDRCYSLSARARR